MIDQNKNTRNKIQTRISINHNHKNHLYQHQQQNDMAGNNMTMNPKDCGNYHNHDKNGISQYTHVQQLPQPHPTIQVQAKSG